MDKFERVGVNLLYDTTNTQEANDTFAYSCNCCSSRGRHSDCRKCAIASTHSLLTAYFADKERQE